MCEHFWNKSKNGHFQCTECKAHHCCDDTCERYYNSDRSLVCPVTGSCSETLIADNYQSNFSILTESSMCNFENKVKSSQQTKNKVLNPDLITKILNNIVVLKKLGVLPVIQLTNQILALWRSYVTCTDIYTHRKDRKCFIIAIIFSLRSGLLNNKKKFIVHKHQFVEISTINKKKTYKFFKVNEIRYGIKLLQKGFKDVDFFQGVNINENPIS